MHRYVNRIILVLAIVGRRRQNMQYGFAVGGPRTTIEYDAVLEVPQPKVQYLSSLLLECLEYALFIAALPGQTRVQDALDSVICRL